MPAIGHGVEICTSTTRPITGLNTGTLIYETDTKKYLSYNGTSWIELHDLDNIGATSDANNILASSGRITETSMPAGSIVQVVERTTSASQSWASNTNFADNLTDCYCYITPKFSTSKIVVLVYASTFCDFLSSSDVGYGAGIYSNIGGQLQVGSKIGNQYTTSTGGVNCTINYVAYPATTSNHYYQLSLRPYNNNGGTRVYLNRSYQGTDYSRMILMEVRQ